MLPIYSKHRTIGLLGGSFNPAHSGHLHITLYALKKLKLDAVWWLVSPKNPLKDEASLAAYEKRLQSAKDMAIDLRIHVSDFEARSKTRYSFQTIALLRKRYPGTRFVWLIGADNLAQFHRWRRWQSLLAGIPIVVFDRAPYSHTATRSKAYLRMQRFLLNNNSLIGAQPAPSLSFVHLKRDPMSSTMLRKKLGNGAFLGHNKNVGTR